ncbi:MAG: ATP-dependent nuclease [Nitrospirota bacterium]
MLTSIRLRNFRCFEDHTVPLKPLTVAIGRNNAGKSTLVEAFRLLATVSSRYQGLAYKQAPAWGDVPRREYGVTPSLRGLDIRFDTLFHNYGDPPAIVDAVFGSGHSISLYLGSEEKVHSVIRGDRGDPIRTKAQALRIAIPRVEILPQIGPLSRNEGVLTPDYVKGAIFSHLSSFHFRNQLHVFPEHFPAFKEIAEVTWPGLQVNPPSRVGRSPEAELFMEVRNEAFVGEVGTMGHGLQMWLQTMWFLARVEKAHTVILDEPDVYMHPDLQRRLIRFLRRRFPQVIVATHSVEIMAEVEPDEILVIDRARKRSRFTSNLPAVQALIDHVGSVHNIHLAKLWHARKCVLVEGSDLKLLSEFQQTITPESPEPISALPNMSLGGWGGWQHAVGSSLFLQNTGGESITSYCILDSDYWTDEDIRMRYEEAARSGVQLHVWRKKEIENYLLVPTAIARYIVARLPPGVEGPDSDTVKVAIQEQADGLWDETFDAMAQSMLAGNRALGAGGANQRVREIIAMRCSNPENRWDVVSGKRVLSAMSGWSQRTFSVAISTQSLARTLGVSEVAAEIRHVITAVTHSKPFEPWTQRYSAA